jgi:vancomycin resistance protein YoaR
VSAGAATRTKLRGRRGRARTKIHLRRALVGTLLIAALGLGLGLAFAGSPSRIAPGVTVAGVDVGGLEPAAARMVLERRAAAFRDRPVAVRAGERTWRFTPGALGLQVDWGAAVDAAVHQGSGVGPIRGLKRIEVRVFGADVAPSANVSAVALRTALDTIARAVARPRREASIRLDGLRPVIVPERAGRRLDRRAAEDLLVRAVSTLDRTSVVLPLRVDRPRVTSDDLSDAADQVRTALSRPVRLTMGPTRWRIPRWRVAKLLELPANGRTGLAIGGRDADEWLGGLQRTVDRPPRDADFAIHSSGVTVVPGRPGLALDVRTTVGRLLAAALSPSRRVARVAVATAQPKRSTAEARAMGITAPVAVYETIYGGDANRIHNVQLVARLIDKHVIAPGAEFSFNQATGERTAERGFLEAPVIINGELQTGLGGGVCQVSTTVFNAAYEAGLPITARTNHALYISHYPQGRDATVNYPDVDLKFVNDTGHWLLLRTFVGSSSLVVGLYGTPTHRRVETETAPLVSVSAPLVEHVKDPGLEVGQTAVQDSGEPARRTSVRRKVYDANGKLLSDTTWTSFYRSEPQVVLVGTKPKPEPKPEPKPKPAKPKVPGEEPPPPLAGGELSP